MSNLVLAIDTAAEFGSLALLQGEELLEQVALHSPTGFGHILFGEIDGLLRRHGMDVNHLALIAGGAGPGSFTGVRMALAAVKGLAAATGAKACGVSNLMALASLGQGERRAAVLDARRGEVYVGLFDGRLQPLSGETVLPLADWLPHAGDVDFILAAPGQIADLLEGRAVHVAGHDLAAAIGRIGWTRLQSGDPCDPRSIDANYVRRTDAGLSWSDRD